MSASDTHTIPKRRAITAMVENITSVGDLLSLLRFADGIWLDNRGTNRGIVFVYRDAMYISTTCEKNFRSLTTIKLADNPKITDAYRAKIRPVTFNVLKLITAMGILPQMLRMDKWP